jgi:hypothetical protein
MLSVTGDVPTPETFMTALNHRVEPAWIGVPLKFAEMDESHPDVVVDIVRISGGVGAVVCPLQAASAAITNAAA